MSRIIRKIKASAPLAITRERVAAYARVSSGKDAMLHSLSAQVSYYSSLIQNNPKWEYAGVYADEAMTGTKDNRAQFQNLLEDCRAGKIDMILTKSVSRFARNTLTVLEVVRELKELNIDVYFEKENIHSRSGDGELMLTILASFAEAESISVSENCKWQIRKKFAEGELVNFKFMFGFDISNKVIKVNPYEAEIVRMVFGDYVSGMGTTAIAKKLREMKVDRPRGGKWTSERVAEMLKNEKYTGNSLLQKKFVLNPISKLLVRNRGELPQYYVQDSHPAIIDIEFFKEVQQLLAKNRDRFAGKRSKNTYPFTSKIICNQCGKYYNRKVNHGRVYWACSTYLHFGKETCSAGQIPEKILIKKVNEVLGLDAFDEEKFHQKIDVIQASDSKELTFILKDGREVKKTWQHKSRSKCWDDAMKQKAREDELRRRELRYNGEIGNGNTC